MGEKQALVPKLRFPEFLDAGGWEEKELAEIARFYKGKGISKADIKPNGSQSCIRYGELYTVYGELIKEVVSKTNLSSSELFLSEEGDVIIPSSGETKLDIATAACVTMEGVALGSDINVIRSRLNGVFLSYYLNGMLKYEIAKVAQGDTVVHLYKSNLEKLCLAVPLIDEQQKIADCLSSLDELISAQAEKIDALKTHKKGLMQKLFPREGENTPRLRFPEFRDAGEWGEVKLSTQVELISGMHLAPSEYASSGDIPYFTGPSDYTNNSALVHKWTNKSANVARNGDTLVTVKGSGVGELLLLYLSEVAMGRQLMAVRAKAAHGQFIYHILSMKRQQMMALASGNLIPGLSRGDILGLAISVPGIKEQQRIADCLSYLDALTAAHIEKLDALKSHKKGLMQKLFPSVESVVS